MDDGGYYDFLEMKLVKGELHVRYLKRSVLKGRCHEMAWAFLNLRIWGSHTTSREIDGHSISKKYFFSEMGFQQISLLRLSEIILDKNPPNVIFFST